MTEYAPFSVYCLSSSVIFESLHYLLWVIAEGLKSRTEVYKAVQAIGSHNCTALNASTQAVSVFSEEGSQSWDLDGEVSANELDTGNIASIFCCSAFLFNVLK